MKTNIKIILVRRHVPLFWRLIDCSFGIIAVAVLLPGYRMIKKLERLDGILRK